MKTCNACKAAKPLDEFPKDRAGRKGVCRACYRGSQAARHHQRKNEPEYRQRLLTTRKRHDLKRNYGLTLEAYEKLLAENPSCAICGSPTRLVVDHCHTTKAIRGILCTPCNVGLGMLGESPERLLAAIAYLRRLAVFSGSPNHET